MDESVNDVLDTIQQRLSELNGDLQNATETSIISAVMSLIAICRVQDAQIRELRGAGEPKYTRPARIHVREQRRGEPSSVDLDL